MAALFEGICGIKFVEIRNITPKDFVGNKVKLCTGRELSVPERFVDIAMESAEEYRFWSGEDGNKILSFDLSDERCFKRIKRNADPELENYVIIRRLKKLQLLFNTNAIGSRQLIESGRIDAIKTRMKETGLSAEECLYDKTYRKELYSRYGAIQNIGIYCKKFADLLEA